MSDLVNSPEHYTKNAPTLEPIDIIRHAPFDMGSMLKYLFRAEYKGDPLLDYKKAQYYCLSALSSCQRGDLHKSYERFLTRQLHLIWKYPFYKNMRHFYVAPRTFLTDSLSLIRAKIEEYEKERTGTSDNNI